MFLGLRPLPSILYSSVVRVTVTKMKTNVWLQATSPQNLRTSRVTIGSPSSDLQGEYTRRRWADTSLAPGTALREITTTIILKHKRGALTSFLWSLGDEDVPNPYPILDANIPPMSLSNTAPWSLGGGGGGVCTRYLHTSSNLQRPAVYRRFLGASLPATNGFGQRGGGTLSILGYNREVVLPDRAHLLWYCNTEAGSPTPVFRPTKSGVSFEIGERVDIPGLGLQDTPRDTASTSLVPEYTYEVFQLTTAAASTLVINVSPSNTKKRGAGSVTYTFEGLHLEIGYQSDLPKHLTSAPHGGSFLSPCYASLDNADLPKLQVAAPP
uniref:Uncharacterized protein n=1 Tax=Moniliophthora roreri TaxID=221103 RepID=A0A0W0G5E9_MONRR